jgi:transposase
MKKYLCFVGVDVSKSKLDVSFHLEASIKSQFHFVVSNDDKGIKEILTQLKRRKIALESTLISFEDTGVYSLPLCYYLSKVLQDYWMIPAIEIKRSRGLSRGKNDKKDSKEIALYSFTHIHKLRLSTISDVLIMELKLLFTEREKVLKAITILSSTKEGIGFIPSEIMKSTLKINQSCLKELKKCLSKIEAKMSNLISNDEVLNHQNTLIQSIPGIGPQTAMYLILVTKSFQSFQNWRQLACYAGVAPFEYSSGSSIRGRTKVSHLADKKLKSLLNMCALNAKKYDTELKEYFESKVLEGKSKMLVLNNIRCKLLGRVFAIINRGTPYVNVKRFAA